MDDPLLQALAYASTVAGQRKPHLVREALRQAAMRPQAVTWAHQGQRHWARARLVDLVGVWLGDYLDSTGCREIGVFAEERQAVAWLDGIRAVLHEARWL